jgi:hypothetical protein
MIRIRIKYKPKPIVKVPPTSDELYQQLQQSYQAYYQQKLDFEMVKAAVTNLYFNGKT